MSKRGIVQKIVLVVVSLVGLLGIVFGIAMYRFQANVKRADKAWRDYKPKRLGDIGTTQKLTILPLVDWHASRPNLLTDVGVSYLIKTDTTTVLFDTGNNGKKLTPSPLEANMAALGVSLDSIKIVMISHAHFDHVGGRKWTRGGLSGTTFGIGNHQPSLAGKRIVVPIAMTYPGSVPEMTPHPTQLAPGVATIGTIGRQLFAGWIDEQALAVHVQGRGIVLIVGCGHQTLERILARTEAVFNAPIYGVVGGLHYPVPKGRIMIGGLLDPQRRLASGKGPLAPLTDKDVDAEFAMLTQRKLGLVSIGGHDSSDEVIARARTVFGSAYRELKVGLPITVAAPSQPPNRR